MAKEVGVVQSVSRALDVVEILAAAGGEISISEIAARSELPLPTIHRLLRTLVLRGYAHQTPRRRYALGARFIPLGELAGRSLGRSVRPLLAEVAEAVGESVNLATRDLDGAVYIAHVPSQHSMRMFTEVGRRVELHCTGVGKVFLAAEDDDRIRALAARGLPARTPNTLTDLDSLLAEVERVRQQGFAVDAEEQELGVTCLAVPVESTDRLALSMSAPTSRMGAARFQEALPVLHAAARRLAAELTDLGGSD